MASIHKAGRGWKVRWRNPQGKQRSRKCPDRRSAERLRLEVERCLSNGGDWHPRLEAPPVAVDVLDGFFEQRTRVVKAGRRRMIDTGLAQFEEFVALDFGINAEAVPLGAFDQAVIGRFFDWLVEGGMGLVTAKRRVRDVNAAWTWATTAPRFERHVAPFRAVELPQAFTEHTPKRASWDLLDQALTYALDNVPKHHAAIMLIQRFTGLRAQQVARLEVRDLGLAETTLEIRAEIAKHPKHARVIPVSEHLVAELAALDLPTGAPTAPLAGALVNVDGHHKRVRARAWKRSGVPSAVYHQQTGKVWRVSFASNALMAGVDLGIVKQLIGHVSGDVTLSHYVDKAVLVPRLRAAVAQIPPVRRSMFPQCSSRPQGVGRDVAEMLVEFDSCRELAS